MTKHQAAAQIKAIKQVTKKGLRSKKAARKLLMELANFKMFAVVLMLPLYTHANDITISKDTTLTSNWVLPLNTVIHIINNAQIHGRATMVNPIIDAPLRIKCFDTTISFSNAQPYGQDFSTLWYGNEDRAVQKAADMCIANHIWNCFNPRGIYTITKPIKLANLYNGSYTAVELHFYGESDFWHEATVFNYTATTGFCLGIQVGKGSNIGNITLRGPYKAPSDPTAPANTWRGTSITQGIVIDYDGTKNSGGSTGVVVHDTKVTNFTYCYAVSPNGVTFNADILTLNQIQCGECYVGFVSGQAQEKGNSINGIYSWGKVYCLINIGNEGKAQAGQYTIRGGNVAGGCVNLFNIRQSGWYGVAVYDLFAESVTSIGNATTGDSQSTPPMSFYSCTFHFNKPGATVLTSNSNKIVFTNCLFRYYGMPDTLHMAGVSTFVGTEFSKGGVASNQLGGILVRYANGRYEYGPVIKLP